MPPDPALSCAVHKATVLFSMPCCAGLSGAAGALDIPRPYNTARQYPQIGQLRVPAYVWLPWDVLEDVVSTPTIFCTLYDNTKEISRRIEAKETCIAVLGSLILLQMSAPAWSGAQAEMQKATRNAEVMPHTQVLATMVEEAQANWPGEAQKEITAAVWQLISDALAAGAATLSTTAASAASQPVGLHLISSSWTVFTETYVLQDTDCWIVGTIHHAALAVSGVTGEYR